MVMWHWYKGMSGEIETVEHNIDVKVVATMA